MNNSQFKNLTLIRFAIVGCSLVFGSWHTTSHGQSSSREPGSDRKPMPDRLKAMLDDSARPELNQPDVSLRYKEERVQQIHDRIQLLKSIIDQERQAAVKKPMGLERPMKSLEKNQPLSSTPSAAPAMDKPMNKSMEEQMEPTFVPSIDTEKLATTLPDLTDKPVDAVELAYSLYMTGNYSTAIKNLQAAQQEKPTPAEAAWINCVMGCCYRMQRKLDDSERLFRKTANQKADAGISAKYASWQLRYIEGRRSAIEAMRNLEAELQPHVQEAPQ